MQKEAKERYEAKRQSKMKKRGAITYQMP